MSISSVNFSSAEDVGILLDPRYFAMLVAVERVKAGARPVLLIESFHPEYVRFSSSSDYV